MGLWPLPGDLDGKTWTPATVTGVTAADAAGGQISETITRAYGIAP